MGHARRIITKNRMRASIFVIRQWADFGPFESTATAFKKPVRWQHAQIHMQKQTKKDFLSTQITH
jgi:hypothetical protein